MFSNLRGKRTLLYINDVTYDVTWLYSVHIGKKHSENIKCGLCDTIFQNIELLETHLITCEVYKCWKSHGSFKTLLEMNKT